LKDIGGLNGFDFGTDGWIYGPLWFKHQVVKINPDTGELKVVADGFDTPAAANFDSKGNLYVLDTALGTVNRVDIKTGGKTVVAKLSPSLDNLAIDSKDRIFVSNMADNGIQEVNLQNGSSRQVLRGSLATPVSLSAVAEGNHDLIYVADIFAFRAIDGSTGRVIDIERSHAAGAHIDYPVGVSATDAHVLVTNFNGTLQRYARHDGKLLQEWKGIGASSVLELDGEALLLAQGAVLTRVDSKGEKKQIAGDLGTIQSITRRGNDVYATDGSGGRVMRVNLTNGEKKVVATNLQSPMSIALQGDGGILVIEFGKQRLIRVDPTNGKITELATQLPIGVHGRSRPDIPIGLTVGSNGAIYIASDVENAIYKLTKE
jgi:sugar lactone lactonase YvrE